jgi:outer membrane cobalamin receptor
VYAADLERIEVLEGPQGTLFGAGAQAGVLRYITNKPKLDRTTRRMPGECMPTTISACRLHRPAELPSATRRAPRG